MPAKTVTRSELKAELPRKFFSRTLSEKSAARLVELESEIQDFKSRFAKGGSGGYLYKKTFMALLDNASKAFNAFHALDLAEFIGVSSSTISKIRKGNIPAEATVNKILDTALDACRFYLEKTPSGALPTGWVAVPKSAKACIFELSGLLDAVLNIARGGNEKSDLVLTPIERAELIAMLETTLQILKAPLVEKNFLGKLKDILIRTSKKAVEKQVEIGLSAAAAAAGSALGNLLTRHLP